MSNWHRAPGRPLLDVDDSPALLWERGETSPPILTPSQLGYQAPSLATVGEGFKRWAGRTMPWIRRNGVLVWDCTDPSGPVPHGDVELATASNVWALPGGFATIEQGPGSPGSV